MVSKRMGMLKIKTVLVAAALLVALPAWTAEIRVAVAANFYGTLQKLAPLYQEASGNTLAVSSGASGALTTQILHGAPFDVFLSADAARPQWLEEKGLTVEGSRCTYAYGVPVLWSASEDFVDGEGRVLGGGEGDDEGGDDFRHIAIADPALAPYGAAAREIMTARGVFEPLDKAGKIVRGQSIGQTHSHVASGAAELGFVALAQVTDERGDIAGSHWMPPTDAYAPIAQVGVVLQRADDLDAAKHFLEWLQQDDARAVIEAAGYGVGG